MYNRYFIAVTFLPYAVVAIAVLRLRKCFGKRSIASRVRGRSHYEDNQDIAEDKCATRSAPRGTTLPTDRDRVALATCRAPHLANSPSMGKLLRV